MNPIREKRTRFKKIDAFLRRPIAIVALGRFLPPGGLRPFTAECSRQSAYNARVDRLNAIRLLQALVAAGANTHAPMASDWVHDIALRDMSLQIPELASAVAYAEGEGWLADIPTRKGWLSLTRTGEVVAQANDSN